MCLKWVAGATGTGNIWREKKNSRRGYSYEVRNGRPEWCLRGGETTERVGNGPDIIIITWLMLASTPRSESSIPPGDCAQNTTYPTYSFSPRPQLRGTLITHWRALTSFIKRLSLSCVDDHRSPGAGGMSNDLLWALCTTRFNIAIVLQGSLLCMRPTWWLERERANKAPRTKSWEVDASVSAGEERGQKGDKRTRRELTSPSTCSPSWAAAIPLWDRTRRFCDSFVQMRLGSGRRITADK